MEFRYDVDSGFDLATTNDFPYIYNLFQGLRDRTKIFYI